MSPDEIMDTHLPRLLQLKTIGLMRQNVKMKPAGGTTLRKQVMETLGEWADEWIS